MHFTFLTVQRETSLQPTVVLKVKGGTYCVMWMSCRIYRSVFWGAQRWIVVSVSGGFSLSHVLIHSLLSPAAHRETSQDCRSCLECSQDNGCVRCPDRLFLFLQRDGMSHHGTCVHACPAGHYGQRGKDINRCMSTFPLKGLSHSQMRVCADSEHTWLTCPEAWTRNDYFLSAEKSPRTTDSTRAHTGSFTEMHLA